MKHLVVAAALAAIFPAHAQTAPTAIPVPSPAPAEHALAPCAASGGLLPGSGLCRDDAIGRLSSTRHNAWFPPQGCDRAAEEVALPGGAWLLYAAQRCDGQIARLEAAPGVQGVIKLRYTATARNPALIGKTVLTLVLGSPDTVAAVNALVLKDLPEKQGRRCALRQPDIDGYPIDSYVYDVPAKETRKTAALDAPCGPYGRSASFDGYWRFLDGYGAYVAFGNDQPEFDPTNLAIYRPGR